jgi:adenine-specific DNA-methyltransferase
MNKTDLIQKVKALDGLSQDERAYLINLVNTKKKYGLVWEEKPEEVEEQLRENLPVLKEVKDKAIVNGEDYPNHILIEGDNLHALTTLSFTHEGKIDIIYIDPPYNTGKKDFKYHDAFKDEPEFIDKEHPFRHSTWLSFMHKRLEIAKLLLSDTGVIFISIDDNEQAQLKLLCDEIFKEENGIETYFWESTFRPDNSSKILRKNAEFVLCYAKSKSNIKEFKGIEYERTGLPSLTKATMPIGELLFDKKDVDFQIKNGLYKAGVLGEYELLDDVEIKDKVALSNFRLRGRMIWGQDYLRSETERGTRIIIKTKGFVPYSKKPEEGLLRPPKIIPHEIVGDVLSANAELDLIFGKRPFRYPKPATLISYLINFLDIKDCTVLDFFAGSGTTLHALMHLNSFDRGNRKCILITNNENNICEEVTYERNSRLIQGFATDKGVKIAGLIQNNLRYYKSEFVGRETSLKNKRELTLLATELLCIKEDCYTEQKIKIKHAKQFANAAVTLLILFDDHIIPEAVELIKVMDAIEIKVYVFSMGSDPYTEDFAEVLDKVTLCALPDAIYKAYQNVLPKKKRTVPLIEEVSEMPTNENDEQLSIL